MELLCFQTGALEYMIDVRGREYRFKDGRLFLCEKDKP